MTTAAADIYERLGAFYLGREYDMRSSEMRKEPLLYDSKDLVTHAVIVGMTGSGKTGLGVALLEEAAIDSIPALVIDPKGDLTNLLLNFPELRAQDFEPWINADDAARAGKSVTAFAAQQAVNWREGLAKWDQDGARIRRLGTSAEFTIYTPGSDAGFLPLRRTAAAENIEYRPHLVALTTVHFVDTRKGLAAEEDLTLLCPLSASPLGVDWSAASEIDLVADALEHDLLPDARFADTPAIATKPRSFTRWRKALDNHLYHTRRFAVFYSSNLKEYSEPGETERDFRIRLTEHAGEERDRQVDRLRKKYASKIETLQERIRKAELRVDKESREASGAHVQTAISLGATILSAVLGRKSLSSRTIGRATTTARGVGRASKQADDVRRAQQDVIAYEDKLREMETELADEVEGIQRKLDPLQEELDTVQLKPRRTDIAIHHLALAWVPVSAAGEALYV